MRIRSVHIDNFRGLNDFSISFLDEDGKPRPLTVIVGPNMSGKTTILDAIHLVHATLENVKDPKLRSEFDPNDPMNRPDSVQPIRIKITFSLDDGEWDTLDQAEKALGNAGLKVVKAETYEITFCWPPPANSHFGVLNPKPYNANLAFRGRAVAKVAKSQGLVTEKIFDDVGTVLYLDQHRNVELHAREVRTGRDELLRENAASRDVLPWLVSISILHDKWDASTQGESTWSRVKRLYAQLATPAEIDDIKAFDEGFDLRLRTGNKRFYYSAGMSSGERQLLRLATNLVAARAQRSVVLIDELELHLHPQWQGDLLAFCRKGGGDSNQFIVTTHSESILRYVDPADVIKLGELGGT